MLACVRNHWSVENKLHWILDMNFKEDSCRTRTNHGAENLNLIRKSALNLIRSYNPDGKKVSAKIKMLNASCDFKHLKSLLIINNL